MNNEDLFFKGEASQELIEKNDELVKLENEIAPEYRIESKGDNNG